MEGAAAEAMEAGKMGAGVAEGMEADLAAKEEMVEEEQDSLPQHTTQK